MTVTQLFATLFYQDRIADAALLAELEHSCRSLAKEDKAGQAWCRDHAYPGYTSYASLNDLPMRDPVFAELAKRLTRHVSAFAAASAMDLSRKAKLDSLWVNVMKPGGSHAGHIHPHSIISGTFYVSLPKGSGSLKLEDPRLPMMMAAPSRTEDAPEQLRSFVYREPEEGSVFLWESWLRHEVQPSTARGERISISFNYR